MSDRSGPMVTINASCSGCEHVLTERYRAQGDSGCDVYCTEPSVVAGNDGERRNVGDTRWSTPAWCPLLQPALKALLGLKP